MYNWWVKFSKPSLLIHVKTPEYLSFIIVVQFCSLHTSWLAPPSLRRTVLTRWTRLNSLHLLNIMIPYIRAKGAVFLSELWLSWIICDNNLNTVGHWVSTSLTMSSKFSVLIPGNPRSLRTDFVTLRATSNNSFSTLTRTFCRTSSYLSSSAKGLLIYRKIRRWN